MSSREPATGRPPTTDAPSRGWSWAEAGLPAALVALGVFTIIEAGTIVVPGSSNTVGPQAFPYAVGFLLVGTGAAVLVGISRGIHGRAEEGEDVDVTLGTDWITVAKLTGSFFALVVLVDRIGWLLASALFFAGAAWSLGARPWWRPIAIGLVLGLVTQVVFTYWLGVYLPPGPFEGVPFLDG